MPQQRVGDAVGSSLILDNPALVAAFALAILLKLLSRGILLTSLLAMPGTIAHELAHLLAGYLFMAKPVKISILPRRGGGEWIMGSVAFSNITWYNGAFVGFAPLALAPAAWWLTQRIDFAVFSARTAFLLWVSAAMLQACFPSRQDMVIALKSWPVFVMLFATVGAYYGGWRPFA